MPPASTIPSSAGAAHSHARATTPVRRSPSVRRPVAAPSGSSRAPVTAPDSTSQTATRPSASPDASLQTASQQQLAMRLPQETTCTFHSLEVVRRPDRRVASWQVSFSQLSATGSVMAEG